MLACTALAPKARDAVLEDPARQELPELAFDERRQAVAVPRLRHRGQEGIQVFGDDLMEHGVLGVSGAIHGRDTRHAPG